MENNNRITLPGKGHAEIVLESINAIDEDNNWRVIQDGRTVCKAQWQDDDDVRIYLTAIRGIDPKTKNMSEDRQKPWTCYYLLRQSSMPGFDEQKFFFSARQHEDKVWLCDTEGKSIRHESHEQNIEYMNIVVNALRQRPTRHNTDETVRLFALENIMSSDKVKTLISRLDDGTKNSIGINQIMNFIIQNEPILTNDRELIESYIQDLHAWHITDNSTPDPV